MTLSPAVTDGHTTGDGEGNVVGVCVVVMTSGSGLTAYIKGKKWVIDNVLWVYVTLKFRGNCILAKVITL